MTGRFDGAFLRWLIAFAGIAGLSLGLLAADDWRRFHADVDQSLARLDTRLDQARQLLERSIVAAGRNVSQMSGLPSIQAVYDRPGDAAENEARGALRRMIALQPDYMQVRLIDVSGQERIRFDRFGSEIFEMRGDRLQNKAHRYYIETARHLEPGQFYVSPIDLNIEHGNIERPLRPVIRVASPVYSTTGTTRGFAIVNCDMTPLFNQLDLLFGDDVGELAAVKPDGTWMLSKDPALNWGDQLGHDARFQQQHPQAWAAAQHGDGGHARLSDGWFAFRPVELTVAPDITMIGQPMVAWLFVSVAPDALYWHPLQRAHRGAATVFLVTAASALLALVVAILWSQLIHSRRQHRANLRDLTLANVIYENADEALFVTDENQRIVSVNTAAARITGYTAHELIGATPRLWRSGRQPPEFYTDMWHAIERAGQWKGEIINRRKDGELFQAWESIAAVRDQAGRLVNYVSVMTDISALKITEDRLRHLAFHDPLSGLPNRMLFTNNLQQLIELCRRSGETFALAVIDLDHFKLVNDSLGHEAGDRLIKTVAERLQQGSRSEDTVSRLGGDEFAIIMPGVNSAEVIAGVMHRTLDNVSRPVTLDGREVHPRCSVGIALFPSDGDNEIDLFKAADAAMYESKRRRKHECVFHSPELQLRVEDRMDLEEALRHAMGSREFELFYQPQVDIDTGTLLGAEALIRWHHPRRGLISPDQFIPIAEESSLINDIGTWVATQACSQAASWPSAIPSTFRVAINISGHQLSNEHGRTALLEALQGPASTGCPLLIELELGEAMFFDNRDSIEFLRQLRGLGVSIAIDDFGVGNSSLAQLRELPVDRLKIAGEFVRTMDTDAGSHAIVRALIQLAHDLGKTVLAENVETPAQRDALRELGCHEAQGFLFGKPMRANEFRAYLRKAAKAR